MGLFRNVSPKNSGRAKAAQSELDWSIDRANAQYLEALKVDGIQINYWKRTEEGMFCTCGFGHNHVDNVAVNSNLTNEPVRSDAPQVLDQLPTHVIDSQVVPQESTYQVRGFWDNEKTEPLNPKELGVEVTTSINSSNDIDNTSPNTTNNVDNDAVDNAQYNDANDFFAAPPDYDLLSGMEKTQCGICLGSGKTQAWNLVAGKREIFNNHNMTNLSGFIINKADRPYSFEGSRNVNNYVEWLYVMPTYFESCLNYAVRNNTKAVREIKIFYKISGTQDAFQRLTLEFLNSRKGTPTTLILRAMPILVALEGTYKFTHLELVWQLAKFPLAAMAPLSVSTNQQVRDVIVSSSFTLPPTILEITKNDVIYDSKYNRMWGVSDYTDFMTSRRQILGWTVSARGLQQFEQRSLLMVAVNRYYEVAYKGLQSSAAQLLQDFSTI